MDWCTGRQDITEMMLKTATNTYYHLLGKTLHRPSLGLLHAGKDMKQ